MTTKETSHTHLKQLLGLPEYYGHNLDALWDCLTSCVELPVLVRWLDFSISQEYMGDYAQQMLAVFQDAEQELPGFRVEVEA